MKKLSTQNLKKYYTLLGVFFLMVLAAEDIAAQFIRNNAARANVRGTSRRTARRVDRRHDYYRGGSGYYAAPVAAAAVAGAAAAVIYSLPGGCVDRSGYYYCNGTYYQPQQQGAEVVYVQVEIDD